jgi:multiple sugar transport system substrate-binding protein
VRPLTPLYAQLSDLLQRQVNGLLTTDAVPASAMGQAQYQSAVLLESAAGEHTASRPQIKGSVPQRGHAWNRIQAQRRQGVA